MKQGQNINRPSAAAAAGGLECSINEKPLVLRFNGVSQSQSPVVGRSHQRELFGRQLFA